MVDVVDEKNNVLYSIRKDEAHAKGLLHRTVVAEVRDNEGKIILVKQAPDRQDPGQYVSPVGGHVSSGETEEHALKRETEEEIGLKDIKYKLKGKFIFNRFVVAKNRQENHYMTLYEIYCDGKLNLGPEAVGYKAFTEEELKKRLKSNPEEFGGAYFAVIGKFYPHLLA
jgi:8-oxo-dGTP pyrophosphatase MutT (NUDIX family)